MLIPHPTENVLYISLKNHKLLVVDTEKWKIIHEIDHPSFGWCLQISQKFHILIAGGKEDTLGLWDITDSKNPTLQKEIAISTSKPPHDIQSLLLNNSESRLLLVGGDFLPRIYSTATWDEELVIDHSCYRAVWGMNDNSIIAKGQQSYDLIDLESQEVVFEYEQRDEYRGSEQPVAIIPICPNGLLGTVFTSGKIMILEQKAKEIVRYARKQMGYDRNNITDICWGAGGDYMISATEEGNLYFWVPENTRSMVVKLEHMLNHLQILATGELLGEFNGRLYIFSGSFMNYINKSLLEPRVFEPLSEQSFKEKMLAAMQELDRDRYDELDSINGYTGYRYNLPQVIEDLQWLCFDGENSESDGLQIHPETKMPFVHMSEGGDWEFPVDYIVYWDGVQFRGYVPTEGSAYDRDTNTAYGSEEEGERYHNYWGDGTEFDAEKYDEDFEADELEDNEAYKGKLDYQEEPFLKDIAKNIQSGDSWHSKDILPEDLA